MAFDCQELSLTYIVYHPADLFIPLSLTTSKSRVVPYLITSIGHGADPGFLAVSPQVTLVIKTVLGCHYFPPGLLST